MWKRILKWTGISVGAILMVLVLYLWLGDLDWVGGKIESMVEAATGREMEMASFELDVLWTPALEIEGLTIANADWGTEPNMVELAYFSARLNLWSLILQPILIEEFVLRDVRVLLEKNADGEANWEMEPTEPEEEEPEEADEGPARLPVIVVMADLGNVAVTYREPEAEDRVASLDSIEVGLDENRFLALDGRGSLDHHDLTLKGQVGPMNELRAGNSVSVDLDMGLGSLEIDLEGATGDLDTFEGTDLTALVANEDVVPLLETLGIPLAVTGALRLEASLTPAEGGAAEALLDVTLGELSANARLHTVKQREFEFEASVPAVESWASALAIEGVPAGTLEVSGGLGISDEFYELRSLSARLGGIEVGLDGAVGKVEGQGADASIDLRVASLSEVSPDLPDVPLAATASAYVTTSHVEAGSFTLTIDRSDLGGSMELQLEDPRMLTAKLASEQIDLSAFRPSTEEMQAEVAAGDADSAPLEEIDDEAEDAQTSEWVFVDEPFDFSAMQAATMDVELRIGELILGASPISDVAADLTAQSGALQLIASANGAYGGRAAWDVSLDTSGDQAVFDVLVMVRDLRANLLSHGVEDPMRIPPVGITVDFEGAGTSPRQLAESINGNVLVTMGSGTTNSTALQWISGDLIGQLLGALNPFSREDTYSQFDCAVFALEIEDGFAEITEMYVQGQKFKVVGKGNVDLATERLKIGFNTKPRAGIGLSADMVVTPFVRLAGTLANPRLGVSKKGALLTGGAAVLTGGLSVLAQSAIDRLAGEGDHCPEALAGVGGHPPIEQPAPAAALPTSDPISSAGAPAR